MHQDWFILELVGPKDDAHMVIDVGVRNGWFFQCWKEWCPSVIVYAFEANAETCDQLEQRDGNDNY